MGFLVWVICCFIPFSQRIAIFLLVDWWRHWLSWGSSIPGGLRDNGRSDDVSFKRVFRQGHSFPRFWFSEKKVKVIFRYISHCNKLCHRVRWQLHLNILRCLYRAMWLVECNQIWSGIAISPQNTQVICDTMMVNFLYKIMFFFKWKRKFVKIYFFAISLQFYHFCCRMLKMMTSWCERN